MSKQLELFKTKPEVEPVPVQITIIAPPKEEETTIENKISWDLTIFPLQLYVIQNKHIFHLYFNRDITADIMRTIISCELMLLNKDELIEQFIYYKNYMYKGQYQGMTTGFYKIFDNVILPVFRIFGNIDEIYKSYYFDINKALPVSSGEVNEELIKCYEIYEQKKWNEEKRENFIFSIFSYWHTYKNLMPGQCDICGIKTQVARQNAYNICCECFLVTFNPENITKPDIRRYIGDEIKNPVDMNGNPIINWKKYISPDRDIVFINESEIRNLKGEIIEKDCYNYDFSKLILLE